MFHYVLSVFTLIVFRFSYRLAELVACRDEEHADSKPTQDRHNDEISSQAAELLIFDPPCLCY